MLDSWLPFLIYGSLALVIPASMILMSFLFATRPRARRRARYTPFESGVAVGPPQQQRFTVSFYLTAMLFIVFDIEIVFLYPIAMKKRNSQNANQATSLSTTAIGYRNTISMSKTMKSIAVR